MRFRPATPWFPAKRHGFGWSLPRCAAGWIVLLAFLTAIYAALAVWPGPMHPLGRINAAAALIAALFAVCGWTGESPGRRSG